MKKSKAYDSSYVFHYVLDLLYSGCVVVVSDIVYKFEYDKSSIYKMLKRIDYNLLIMGSQIELVKINVGSYKFKFES